MPGPIGLSADGTPGETEEEHMQRWRDAIAHNERFFASQNNAEMRRGDPTETTTEDKTYE